MYDITPHEPPLQASSSPILRIRIWPICCDLCRLRWRKITQKVYLSFFLLVACCVTVSAVEDNFEGENVEDFSQNGPSHTYEIIK